MKDRTIIVACFVFLFCLPGLVAPFEASAAGEGRLFARTEASQDAAGQTDPWALLRLLEGRWEGAIDGRLGTGVGVRDYEFILEGKYLKFEQASVRRPQELSPAGDHHREMSIFSFDTSRQTLVLREFMIEGFVLTSTCETEGRRIVCISEDVESGPGMRSRLTLEIDDAFRFTEIFELASPGEELAVYFTNVWTRIPVLR